MRLGGGCRKGSQDVGFDVCHHKFLDLHASMPMIFSAADRQPGMESLLQSGFIIITYVCVCVCVLALIDFNETTNSQAWYRSQLAEVGEGM